MSSRDSDLKSDETQLEDQDSSEKNGKTTMTTTMEQNAALDNLAATPIQLVVQPTPLTPAPTPIVTAKTVEKKSEPKETLIEVPSDEVGRVENKIDNVPFYHGFMGRAECESMLSDHGDFLVRMTEIGKRVAYVISIKWDKQNVHILVKRTKTKQLYWTQTYAFKSVCELIAYHKQNHLPIYKDMILICGLARHEWQLNNEQVTLDKKLGEGQFGEVHKGKLKTSFFSSPIIVAVKTLHQNHLSANEKILFLREANVMLTLSHPNVIRFHGVCTMKEPIMIVMEFCDGQSLEDALLAKQKVSDEDKILYLFHAACGIDYLHGRHVIHRDIAARNCLLNSNKVLKISDFGLSVKGVAIKERKGGCLPVKYMAPETLKKGLYSTASDIYSYGALIYEVYTDGKTPFESCGKQGNDLRKAIIGKTVTLSLDVEAPVFMKTIFDRSRQYETEERVTARAIIDIFKTESGLREPDTRSFLRRLAHIGGALRRARREQVPT